MMEDFGAYVSTPHHMLFQHWMEKRSSLGRKRQQHISDEEMYQSLRLESPSLLRAAQVLRAPRSRPYLSLSYWEDSFQAWCEESKLGQRLLLAKEKLRLKHWDIECLALLLELSRQPIFLKMLESVLDVPGQVGTSRLGLATFLALDDAQRRKKFQLSLSRRGLLAEYQLIQYRQDGASSRASIRLSPKFRSWLLGEACMEKLFSQKEEEGAFYRESEKPSGLVIQEGESQRALRELVSEEPLKPQCIAIESESSYLSRSAVFSLAKELSRPVLHIVQNELQLSKPSLIKQALWASLLSNALLFIEADEAFLENMPEDLLVLFQRPEVFLLLAHQKGLSAFYKSLKGARRFVLPASSKGMAHALLDEVLKESPQIRDIAKESLLELPFPLDVVEQMVRLLQTKRLYLEAEGSLSEAVRELAFEASKGVVSSVAERMSKSKGLDTLGLHAEEEKTMHEIKTAWLKRKTLIEDWGFGRRISSAESLSVLFYGPPGTGKTLAASALAYELGLQLYKVDLSKVVDKYIGETEKKIEEVFSEVERLQGMILFDEADSLFSARGEVNKASDRYKNMKVSFLLQRIEAHRGIVVLTTNHEALLDDAFKRRIRYSVPFPMPDVALRKELWRRLIPKEAPTVEDIDFQALAEAFEMSGGHIYNAILRASFKAASMDLVLSHKRLWEAAVLEYQSLGFALRF